MQMLRLLCLIVLISSVLGEVTFKSLAGPPSDFSLYTLPTPLQNADTQNSATFSVDLVPSQGENSVLTQTLSLPVDSQDEFSFTFYSPSEDSVRLSLSDPNGKDVWMHKRKTYYPIGDLQVAGTEYRFHKPTSGTYTLTIKTTTLNQSQFEALTTNSGPDAYVVLWNEDALATHTVLNTYSLLTNSQIGLVTRVYNSSSTSDADIKAGKVPQALQNSIQDAVMNVVLPSGATVTADMLDDGMHDDGAANDGVYGALITASAPGQYILSANVQGTNNGVTYVRTTQQLATVVNPSLTLLGFANGTLDSTQTVLTIAIAASAPTGAKYKAYAEVWGEDKNGHPLAVAWIGGMTVAQGSANNAVLDLALDLNWVSRVQALAPLSLKNVVFQDPDTFVPVAMADVIPVSTPINFNAYMIKIADALIGENGAITPEMLEGRRPDWLTATATASADVQAAILLVHGYCSKVNPWQKYAGDWTNAYFFLKASQNFPHDQFALEVLSFANSIGAFSYVGHSQGGAVGLHIKNYYWSGLDIVTGGRILQSVGTPYQGSSGAGTAADLIKLFGVLCGANQDLTKDGSSLWLQGITAPNRALVYYYTTTYEQGKFFGDYCNLAVNLVLKWPNDGVAEYELSQLPGGQNQGNTEKWCHSVDMKYPAQCENRDRNKIMNSAAARQLKA